MLSARRPETFSKTSRKLRKGSIGTKAVGFLKPLTIAKGLIDNLVYIDHRQLVTFSSDGNVY